jgi:type II secretion system protein H
MNLSHHLRESAGRGPAGAGWLRSFKLSRRSWSSGFTLIEVILVMVILTATVALAAPRLASFFRGRALDSEARRLLALTRYAQDRAASEGVPVRMWFDVSNGKYGIRPESGYQENAATDVTLTIGDGIRLEVISETRRKANQPLLRSTRSSAGSTTGVRQPADNLPGIGFLPEGLIDPEQAASISLTDADGYSVKVAPDQTFLHYEITGGAR